MKCDRRSLGPASGYQCQEYHLWHPVPGGAVAPWRGWKFVSQGWHLAARGAGEEAVVVGRRPGQGGDVALVPGEDALEEERLAGDVVDVDRQRRRVGDVFPGRSRGHDTFVPNLTDDLALVNFV